MKLFIEGVLTTGETKIGWLKVEKGIPFVCVWDKFCGEMVYTITEIKQYVGIRGMKQIFIGEKCNEK